MVACYGTLIGNHRRQAAHRSVSVPMTLSDPNPSFKVTVYYKSQKLKIKNFKKSF